MVIPRFVRLLSTAHLGGFFLVYGKISFLVEFGRINPYASSISPFRISNDFYAACRFNRFCSQITDL